MMAKTNRLGPLVAVVGLLAAVGLLIALMMLVVEAKPAEAAFPGKNGRIAYLAFGERMDEAIYTIKVGGGGKTQVTNTDNANEFHPSYSPDGKKIACSGFDGHDYEIYTIDVGGGGKFRVTHNNAEDFSPSWGVVRSGFSSE